MKVSIVIPVYNEARTVDALLERVWSQSLPGFEKELLVIESNSTDGSRELVQNFITRHPNSKSCSIQAIYEIAPRGKGHAVRQGFKAASGDIFLIQDADLEYDPADYQKLLQPIAEGRAAFVLGSRYMGPRRWRIRKFGTIGLRAVCINYGARLFHKFFNLLFGSRLTDPTTMYKVFRAECLRGLHFTCDRFDFDFELLGKLMLAGFVPVEIPVSYRSRGYDQGKKADIWRDSPIGPLAIIKTRFAR